MSYVKTQSAEKIDAIKDVAPEIEKLRARAGEKIQEFMLKKIESLKAPNTNISMTQMNVLLKYKELFWFLLDRYSEVAVEITNNYVVTVGQCYLNCFEKYVKLTQRIQTSIADKNDLIGGQEIAKRGIFGTGNKTQLRDKSNVFCLGERVEIITHPEAGIIVPQAAEDQNSVNILSGFSTALTL
jgi:hypothetical protein